MSTQIERLENGGVANPTRGIVTHKIKKAKDDGVRTESPKIRGGRDGEGVKMKPPNPQDATGECDP